MRIYCSPGDDFPVSPLTYNCIPTNWIVFHRMTHSTIGAVFKTQLTEMRPFEVQEVNVLTKTGTNWPIVQPGFTYKLRFETCLTIIFNNCSWHTPPVLGFITRNWWFATVPGMQNKKNTEGLKVQNSWVGVYWNEHFTSVGLIIVGSLSKRLMTSGATTYDSGLLNCLLLEEWQHRFRFCGTHF